MKNSLASIFIGAFYVFKSRPFSKLVSVKRDKNKEINHRGTESTE